MRQALVRHDQVLGDAIGAHAGLVFSTSGDGFAAAFERAGEALAAAVEAQRGLAGVEWPAGTVVRVRMGLHTGEAEERGGDYFGGEVNRAARLMAVAHGGQIVCSQAMADLVWGGLVGGVSLADLGVHRLRDLSVPVRVFQVVHPELPSRFPSLRSLDSFPGNLPLQVSSFVGREQELARIGKLLEESRVVTLTGVGGVGKTRLALQMAGEVLPRFRDGVWLCELAAVRDPDRVTEAVAGVFRVTTHPGMSWGESVVSFLHDQTLLLVLDNCEHLLDAAAEVVELLDRSCPGVVILATSREPLGIMGEHVLGVRSLPTPARDSGLAEVARADAVRLFVDRAQAAKDDFALTESNAGTIRQLCERLDGVPLAIELAAARIPAMSPAELVRRLDRRFELLSGGRRRAVERHQTLRATIDWSYELCSEAERRLLARLSVFAGGCTLDAAEDVCGFDPLKADGVLDLLASLVGRSLVVADDTGPDTRYRLLETIRQYGEERLAETGETDVLRSRHVDHLIGFSAQVSPHLTGRDELEWGARLAAEVDNYQAAMEFAVGTGEVGRAMELVSQIPSWILQVNYIVFLYPEAVLALPGAAEHPGSVQALVWAAYGASVDNDYSRALQLIARSEEAERRLGTAANNADVEGLRKQIRSSIEMATGDLRQAAELNLEAAALQRTAGHPATAAWYQGTAAQCLSWIDPDAAVATAREGLAMARQSGSPSFTYQNLCALALALADSHPDEARQLLAEAASLNIENMGLIAACTAAGRLGEWPLVLKTATQVLRLEQRTGRAGRFFVGGVLNLAARGLAPTRPETAARIQGAVPGLSRPASAEERTPPAPGETQAAQALASRQIALSPMAAFFGQVRKDTTQIVVQSIGEQRMRELRALGAADPDQACSYARTHINEYLATTQPAS
jgi:predicted ATPase